MILADAHCHLGSRQFDNNREEVLSRMLENGVEKAVMICCSEHDRLASIGLRDRYPGFKIALGIHPQDLEDDDPQRLTEIRKALTDSHADMRGEIGLDYYSHPHTKEAQLRFFEAQMEMAAEMGLPVDIHSRKASLDILNMLKRFPVKGIIHSYSGSAEMAQLYINLGYGIAFGASVLFPNSRKPAEVIKSMPLDRLLIETDAPYQSPVKGHIHEPADVKAIYEKISEIRGISIEELAAQIELNWETVFRTAVLS